MRTMRPIKAISSGAITILALASLVPAGASSANISRSYSSETNIKNGSIVSLDPTQQDFVQLANIDNGSRIVGVAVVSSESLLAVDPTEGAVQVATSGSANTLVSNLNGDIKVGDKVAVSPFGGIGMKAEPGSAVVGLAQTGFSKDTGGAVKQEITNKNGHKSTIYVGFVRLNIAIGSAGTANSTERLSGLQKLAKSLTGHTISNTRVVVALIVAGVALLALITLVYASIYGSIISIGRNPLAKYAVFRTLGSVLGMVVMISIIAALTVFFLLR
jgi:hypothetical protein